MGRAVVPAAAATVEPWQYEWAGPRKGAGFMLAGRLRDRYPRQWSQPL